MMTVPLLAIYTVKSGNNSSGTTIVYPAKLETLDDNIHICEPMQCFQ